MCMDANMSACTVHTFTHISVGVVTVWSTMSRSTPPSVLQKSYMLHAINSHTFYMQQSTIMCCMQQYTVIRVFLGGQGAFAPLRIFVK